MPHAFTDVIVDLFYNNIFAKDTVLALLSIKLIFQLFIAFSSSIMLLDT
jgi:hypothetical protein